MKCAKHPEIEAVAYCGHCGRALCVACKHEVRGVIYCEDCLAARMATSGIQPPLGGPGMATSPGVALGLGFIPGVGAIYNGQFVKAIVQVLIFGSIIALSNRMPGPMDAIFGMGGAAFYFYMVIDSYRTAQAKAMGFPVPEWFGLGDLKMNAPVGAAALIVIGSLFLLDNFGIHVFRHLGKAWPLLLIGVGILLLRKQMGGGGGPPPSGPQIPGSPPSAPGNITGTRGL